MTRRTWSATLLWLLLLLFQLPMESEAQVVVYRLEFKHRDGFNVDYYNGGYLAAPLLGGSGNFLLTAVENGRRVLDTSSGSGAYFLARDGDKRYNVISATVGSGAEDTTGGSYVAYGPVDRTLDFATPTSKYKIRVAGKLKGESIAADDEGGEAKFNGSVGTANFSDLTVHLDEGLTKEYNEKGYSLEEVTTRLTRLLRWRGYATPATTDGGGNGNGTGTGTGNGTGTGTGTDTGTGAGTDSDV